MVAECGGAQFPSGQVRFHRSRGPAPDFGYNRVPYRTRLKPFVYLRCRFSGVQIQLYGYNTDLYSNMSEAQMKSQGIVGVSLMVQVSGRRSSVRCSERKCILNFFFQIGQTTNSEFQIVTNEFNKLLYKGKRFVPDRACDRRVWTRIKRRDARVSQNSRMSERVAKKRAWQW